MFKSKTNLADYHDEMNNQHVMEWLTQQLLPNIPVVDVEKDYFEKYGLVEDLVDDFVVEFGEEDDSGSDDEEELMDDEDRRLIDNAIRQTTTDTVPTICTNPRRDLTGILENSKHKLRPTIPYLNTTTDDT